MQLSTAGLQLIKRSEGFRGRVYRDQAGFPTIGYGHKVRANEDFTAGIGEEQAERLLGSDVREAEQAVTRLVHVSLTQGQFDALVDFCFNLGAGRLAGSSLLRDLNAGRPAEAAAQLLRWDHAGGVENVGLKARREAEYRRWTEKEVPVESR